MVRPRSNRRRDDGADDDEEAAKDSVSDDSLSQLLGANICHLSFCVRDPLLGGTIIRRGGRKAETIEIHGKSPEDKEDLAEEKETHSGVSIPLFSRFVQRGTGSLSTCGVVNVRKVT